MAQYDNGVKELDWTHPNTGKVFRTHQTHYGRLMFTIYNKDTLSLLTWAAEVKLLVNGWSEVTESNNEKLWQKPKNNK